MKFVFSTKRNNTDHEEHEHAVKGSIRKRFLRIFTFFGLFPVLSLGLAGIALLIFFRQQNIQELEKLLLTQKAQEVSNFVDETLGTFDIQAAIDGLSPPSQGYILRNKYEYVSLYDQQLFLLAGILAENQYLADIAFLGVLPEDPQNLGVITPPGQETKRLAQEKYEVSSPDCGLVPKDVEGASIVKPDECQYYATYDLKSKLFKSVTRTDVSSNKRHYISDPYLTSEGYILTIAAPVRNKNDQIIGAIRGELLLEQRLKEMFKKATLGETGYIYLVDGRGLPIVSSSNINLRKTASLDNPLVAAFSKNPISTDVVGATKIYENALGEKVIGSIKPLGRLNLALVTEWPYSDAYGIVYSAFNQVLFFAFLILGTIFVASGIVARQITKPITVLQFAASRIGKGSFEPVSEIVTGDELELLGHSLNDMAKELKELDTLKQKAGQAKLLELSLAKEKELVEIKDSFLDTASHQLRTPISAIRWQLELLLDKNISAEDKELVSGAYEHAEFLSEISTDLINAASYGIDYKAKDFTEVSIGKVLAEISEHFASAIEKNKLKFVVTPMSEEINIMASYPALRVLFENLIGNAIRYTKSEGQITITVLKQEKSVEVRISDTGIGIPAEEHKMIFTQFFRAVNAIETRNVGTGLGLYIAKNIVLGHEGNIWFTSELGKGSTFFVNLPLKT